MDSTKSLGQNNNSDTYVEFRIRYVGAIEKLKLSEGKSLEGPLDLINYIDAAQQGGKQALYLIIQMVCYDHGLGAGKSLLALKTTYASNEEFSLWVYKCSSLEQAQAICKVLSSAFESC
ncbi:Integrin beta-1-binding protein 1 [Myotis brandtii]|uniref:Integrin beta-1-binding protein 1 n=1 Tax=Myotis brandtii TaxID=109478 RepID=S7PJM9_MYOBR|nr:Integrin beta-1-binding protein 1 [Myotis brandtii]